MNMSMEFKKFHNKILVHKKTFDDTIDNILLHFVCSKLWLYVSFRIPLYCFLFNHDQKAGFMSWLDMSGFEKLTIPSQVWTEQTFSIIGRTGTV